MNTNRDLSAVARSAKVDDAIDHVAARMMHVDDDPMLASRIVVALPERSAWSLHWLMPRLAITAALAIATGFLALRTFDDGSAHVQRNVQTDVPTNVQTDVPTNVQTGVQTNVQTNVRPNDRMNDRLNDRMNDRLNDRMNDRLDDRMNVRLNDRPNDHERSLAAMDAPEALALSSLAPGDLAPDTPLEVAPLEIGALALTADLFPR